MALALFDLDNTLLVDDSDYLWGKFLSSQGLVDGHEYERQNLAYYEQYKAGRLDIRAFLQFSLKPLATISAKELLRLREQFINTEIKPTIAPGAFKLLDQHRSRGDILLIITATNRFITGPIAALLGIDHLLATTPVLKNGAFTGDFSSPACFREGKNTNLDIWLKRYRVDMTGSYFYSDSHNDLPLLERVDHAVAVDPDPTLKTRALQEGWPVISLR